MLYIVNLNKSLSPLENHPSPPKFNIFFFFFGGGLLGGTPTLICMLSDVSFIFKNSFPGLPIKLPQILCDLIHYEKKNLNNFWIKLKKQNTLLSLFIIKNKNFLKSPTTSVNGRMAKYVDYDP